MATLRDKLQGLVDDLDDQIQTLRAALRKMNPEDDTLEALLEAMAAPLLTEGAVFPKRLSEDVRIVVPLTEYYAAEGIGTDEVLFFESGTTPAWLAIMLAAQENVQLKSVVTNNRAVSDVLCSLRKVWETEGWADTKYWGVFPFNSDPTDLLSDELHLQQLHTVLSSRVDRLVLDASRFSFLLGPTVNSWQNVCYKAAAYNVRKPVDLLLPVRKIISKAGTPNGADRANEQATLCWHLTNCYTVFDVPQFEGAHRNTEIIPDIDNLNRQGTGIGRFPRLLQSTGMKKTWVELAESNHDLRIWVGACNEMERAGLLDHLHSLNDTLDGLGYSLRWQVEREAEFQHVHILVVVAGSTP